MSIINDLQCMQKSLQNVLSLSECNICCVECVCYKCIKCEYSTCVPCFKKYILSIPIASCANCDHKLNRELLITIFKMSFVNGPYKEHRENILAESEKALLPETMKYIKLENNIKQFENYSQDVKTNSDILLQKYKIYSMEPWIPKERRDKLKQFRFVIENLHPDIDDPDFIILKKYYEDYNEYKRVTSKDNDDNMYENVTKRNSWRAMNVIRCVINHFPIDDDSEHVVHNFIRKCPHLDCRGYLSTRWKCELCKRYTCNKCYNIHEGECKPEDIASFELIKHETKPCPKCSVVIFKISGCDQMWCTQCHTAFSWNTGRIETHIHNPHYFEYMANRNDTIVNDRCVDFTPPEKFINHYAVAHALLDRHRIKNNGTLDIRFRFLKGEFDDNAFKKEIQKRMKENDKKREFIDICNMFITILTDRLTFYHMTDDKKIVEDDIEELRRTYNILIQRAGISYNSVGFDVIVIENGVWQNKNKNSTGAFKEFDSSII